MLADTGPHQLPARPSQLIMMEIFLGLALSKLKGLIELTWYWLFVPLWFSDTITLMTALGELRRILSVPVGLK